MPIGVIEGRLAVVDHHDVIREAIVGERLERRLHVVRVVLDEESGLEILHGVPRERPARPRTPVVPMQHSVADEPRSNQCSVSPG